MHKWINAYWLPQSIYDLDKECSKAAVPIEWKTAATNCPPKPRLDFTATPWARWFYEPVNGWHKL